MSMILSLLSSHLLSAIEAAIFAEEPTIIAELQLLISKLEAYIKQHSPTGSTVVNPLLERASNDVPGFVNGVIQSVESIA